MNTEGSCCSPSAFLPLLHLAPPPLYRLALLREGLLRSEWGPGLPAPAGSGRTRYPCAKRYPRCSRQPCLRATEVNRVAPDCRFAGDARRAARRARTRTTSGSRRHRRPCVHRAWRWPNSYANWRNRVWVPACEAADRRWHRARIAHTGR